MASGNPLVRWLNNKLSVPQNNSFSDMELELAYQTFKQLCQSPKGMSPGVREMRVEIPSEQQSLFSESGFVRVYEGLGVIDDFNGFF